jgi:hypothetical protein
MENINSAIRVPWNKGKLVGQKAPFKLKEIWAIRASARRLSPAGHEPSLTVLDWLPLSRRSRSEVHFAM